MLKETIQQEIDSLPDSQMQTLLDFIQFLHYLEKKSEQTNGFTSRIPGLDTGTTWVSDDFDDPLPDSFWLGHENVDETPA
jgi:hypothetical protein